ncbi:hypothetical protein [Microbacterium gubbeenense]
MNELYDCDADLFLGRPLWFATHPPRAVGAALAFLRVTGGRPP